MLVGSSSKENHIYFDALTNECDEIKSVLTKSCTAGMNSNTDVMIELIEYGKLLQWRLFKGLIDEFQCAS